MTGRVCFLARAGDALAGVRLVGLRSDESWQPRAAEGPEDVRRDAAGAAAWIAERATTGLSLLCVDVDGSNCRWLTAPGPDAQVIAAVVERQEDGGAEWQGAGRSEASIQALVAPPPKDTKLRLPGKKKAGVEGEGQRLAVLAVPDALARVVVDELDDLGIMVDRAVSLWHAMALAWDPASPLLAAGIKGEGIVGTDAPVTGVVLVDPEGRLVWAWSRAGEMLAGGAILTQVSGEETSKVGRGVLGRLTADWLGWSVQLGVAPSRVVCVSPRLGEGTEEDMQPAQIGAAIGRAWAGATVDMAVHDDPIGATLQRLAGAEAQAPEDARSGLVSLTRRPRRVHRSMYLWAALAVGLAAAGLFGIAIKAWTNRDAARVMQERTLEDLRKQVALAAPPGGDAVQMAKVEGNPRAYLEEQIATKRQSFNLDVGIPAAKPMLSELESLSFVLGNSELEIEEIRLSDSQAYAHVYVKATRVAEELKEALDNVANDHCVWTIEYPQQKKESMQMAWLTGTWKPQRAKP